MTHQWVMRLAFVILLFAIPCIADDQVTTLPSYPVSALTVFVTPNQKILEGKAWLINTTMQHPSYHMHGASKLAFDLSEYKLKPGVYQIGTIARTGTNWLDATNQIPHYRLHVKRPTQTLNESGTLELLDANTYPTVRESGEINKWANWYGSLVCQTPAHLNGNETIVLENLENHGGVIALWFKPVEAIQAIGIQLHTGVPHNAFIAGQKPTLHIEINCPRESPGFDAYLRLDQTDMITHTVVTTVHPIQIRSGQTVTVQQTYPATAGLFRVSAVVLNDPKAEIPKDTNSITQLYACTPAKLARDLPEDWPLAGHVDKRHPPLPGFKYYRFFSHWAKNNPAEDVYKWDDFDTVYETVKNVGGKILLAYDGSPLWTSSRGKVGMKWLPVATAYPPDNMKLFEKYLTELVKRYDDPQGTLAAIETCNEASTHERWQGTPEQLVESAKAIRAAANHASHPIQVIGLAVSAGDHIDHVRDIVAAGILDNVDAVSAHWYEEMMSYELNTPINNLLKHRDMLLEPMKKAGKVLPMINTECGIGFYPRQNGQMLDQDTINERYEAMTDWNRKDKWLVGNRWRRVSERRAAATYVLGTVMLMANQVNRTYYFTQYNFMIDGTPSLPWVALGQLGQQLEHVDYHTIKQLDAHVIGSDQNDGSPKALAYLLGKPGDKQLIVAWSFLSDTSVGRSKHWQRWLEPVDIQITTDIKHVTCTDLYGRNVSNITNQSGKLKLSCGEEPVFLNMN